MEAFSILQFAKPSHLQFVPLINTQGIRMGTDCLITPTPVVGGRLGR
jgi:hypothetical protein